MNQSFPDGYYKTRFTLGSAADPLPESFAVITAWNPMDKAWSERMNRAADNRLRRLLKRQGIPHFRVVGGAAETSHHEPGWAVVIDLKRALAIGRRYRQRAIWWIKDDQLELISSDGEIVESMGTFSERVE